MSANIRSYMENVFDSAVISATSEDSEYPATNIQHTHRTLRWHSTSGDFLQDEDGNYLQDEVGDFLGDPFVEQIIKLDVGAARKVAQYIAVINPNITSGLLTIKATNNSDYVSDLLLEESFSVSPKIFGYGQDRYGERGYGGTLLPEEVDRYVPGGRVLIHHFSVGTVDARYWSLTIPTDCASENAYRAIGRIFGGMYYEPTYNIAYNYILRPIDNSIIKESEGGQPWLDIHPKRREMEFTFKTIKMLEAHFNIFDMMYYYGKRKDIIMCVHPDGTEEEKMFNTIYGRFIDLPGISKILPLYYSVPGSIIFRESL